MGQQQIERIARGMDDSEGVGAGDKFGAIKGVYGWGKG